MKLAQRDFVPLAPQERELGVRENGHGKVQFHHLGRQFAMSVSMKLAQRDFVPLAPQGRELGVRENGHGKVQFHHLGRQFAMSVRARKLTGVPFMLGR